MRLDRFDLKRYGNFTDTVLDFGSPRDDGTDLHVIYGPNEAGKSTLFAAWLDLLFGIPQRTTYGFLHDMASMRVGARLTTDAGATEVVRVKRARDTLLDGDGTPIPDHTISRSMGGLTRESYANMFSLDKITIEVGGNSILSSRGDLGQMLFSASAGLAELTPRIAGTRESLDKFHRPGARSGWLFDAKKQLAALDARIKETEVTLPRLTTLQREAAAADSVWQKHRAEEEAAQQVLGRLRELHAVLPMIKKRAELNEQLRPIAHLPGVDDNLQQRHATLAQAVAQLENSIAERAGRVQGLADRAAGLPSDPEVIAVAEAVAATEALRADHDAAMPDLPRRRDEAAAVQVQIANLLAELGRAGAAPEDVAKPAPVMERLRALLPDKSGLISDANSAAAEVRRAQAALDRERELSGDVEADEDDSVLAVLVARLQVQDPTDARERALRDRDAAQGRVDAALLTLRPWVGPLAGQAEALDVLDVPTDWQIRAWDEGQEAARQAEQDRRRAVEALRAQLAKMRADTAGQAASVQASGMTVADAARARALREARWALHRNALTDATAVQFEQAMREDDRISALMAEALAGQGRAARLLSEMEEAGVRLGDEEALLAEAAADRDAITQQIADACARLSLWGATLPDLRKWLESRLQALTDFQALRDAETGLIRAEADLGAQTETLARALGVATGAAGFDALFATATARLEAAGRRRDARSRLAALKADLRERSEGEVAARAALTALQADWADACRGTVLADRPFDDAGSNAMISRLEALSKALAARADLTHRIAAMEANQARFRTAREAVAARLGLPDATPWADVTTRLRRAEDTAQKLADLSALRDDEAQKDAEDRATLVQRRSAYDALASQLDVPEDATLADHIDSCLRAKSLRAQLAGLDADLRDRPLAEDGCDVEALAARSEAQRIEVEALRARAEASHGAYVHAQRSLDEIGADDALARLRSERENLLLDMRERARDHLAARFGLRAFEIGLRRYREKHRSGMLTCASDAFRRLTLGAYDALDSQPAASGEVLIARARGGGSKQAADMSDGTRFQLYLALRIAGYHELAKGGRAPVPFIGDDIMETFDDARAGEAFGLLGQMSRVGQVIYLTHHRHLIDIARQACPGVRVSELDGARVAANA